MKPLGNQRLHEKDVDEVYGFLDPRSFMERYSKKREPVIFIEASDPSVIPEWADEYLK